MTNYDIGVRIPGVGVEHYTVKALTITGAMTVAELRASMKYRISLDSVKCMSIREKRHDAK